MKKVISAFLLLAVLALSLTACSSNEKMKNPSTKEVADAVKNSTEFTELVELNDSNIDRRYYGISLEDIEEYTVYVCSSGAMVDEIGIFKMKEQDDVEDMLEVVKERKQELYDAFVDYVPEEIGKVNEAVINSKGKYVYFIISENRSEAKKAAESCF